jgi:uncharacterized protein DUF5681
MGTKPRIQKRKLIPGVGYDKSLPEKHKAKAACADTSGKQDIAAVERPNHLWKPGQSGNPAGRPKGARSKFSEALVQAFAQDFEENGAEVIKKVRSERPSEYLKIAASLVPKQMEIEADISGLTHEERVAERERLIAEYEANQSAESVH